MQNDVTTDYTKEIWIIWILFQPKFWLCLFMFCKIILVFIEFLIILQQYHPLFFWRELSFFWLVHTPEFKNPLTCNSQKTPKNYAPKNWYGHFRPTISTLSTKISKPNTTQQTTFAKSHSQNLNSINRLSSQALSNFNKTKFLII